MGDLEHSESRSDFGYCRCTKFEEVERAIRMRRGRATGQNKIAVEFWKSAGRVGMEWLIELFNVIFRMTKMPGEWSEVLWFCCTRTRLIFKFAMTIGAPSY